MKKSLFLLLVLASIGAACKKSKQSDPCDGLLNEGTPAAAGLVFLDGQSGENVLLVKNIDTATINITQEGTSSPRIGGVIVTTAGHPMYGALLFHIADLEKGAFKYKISIPGVDTVTLAYANTEEATGNACRPYRINVNDGVIEDHSFTLSRVDGNRLIYKITQ